jgi:hypothetical protein
MEEGDRAVVGAQSTMREKVHNCEPQPLAVLIPKIERFALDVRPIATAEHDRRARLL